MKSESTINQPTSQRWMVVDDDEGMREFMATLLEMTSDVEAARFASAEDALAAITDSQWKYELILTDLEMPGMNGIELFDQARAMIPGVKALLISGNAMIDEDEILRLGFCGLVRKPFPAGELQQAVLALQNQF